MEGVLRILHGIRASMQEVEGRRSEAFRARRQGLGYCWSVSGNGQGLADAVSSSSSSQMTAMRWV